MTEPLYYSANPVFRVDDEVKGELARDLLRLEVEETTDGLKSLHAHFVAFGPREGHQEEGLLYLDGRILDFGKRLRVAIGPVENQRTIFDGYISAIEAIFDEGAEPQLALCAEDRLMDLRMTRRMRTYEEMSDADIAGEIAREHGLTPDVDAEGPTYDRIQQWNMSDLAFLRERGRLVQAEVWVTEDTLHFKTRDRRDGTSLSLVRGNEILSLQIGADLAHQRTRVRVSGYNARERAVIDEDAGPDAIRGEVFGGRTGPEVLQTAFGERVSLRVREVPLDSGEASDWAHAEMLRRARGFVSASGVTRGTPDMVVGSVLELDRVGEPFNGDGYYVTRVCHTFDLDQGHRTRFEAQRATVRTPP